MSILSDREREILDEVVHCYLSSGEPVASGTVARSSRTGLSSASIRSVMAELEHKGFLVQPHTSAGRVPSDRGLRHYVDNVVRGAVLAPGERRRLRSLLSPAGPLAELLAQATRVLADVTVEVGVALAPVPQRAALRSIHFVGVSPRRVLAVVVTHGGVVDSRILAVEHDYSTDDLERISNYCTQNFTGSTLEEIRDRLLALMAEERVQCDRLLAGVIELGRRTVESEAASGGEVFLEGAERLLERAAPTRLEGLQRLFAAFSDKAALLSLLNRYLARSGPRLVIGSELSSLGNGELGLIVTSFEVPSGESGLVGVIGLKCMDYSRIIPIVDFVGQHLAGVSGDLGSVQ